MDTNTAVKVRRFIPKKRIKKIEKLIVEVGNIVERFECGLTGEDVAQEQLSALFKNAIQN